MFPQYISTYLLKVVFGILLIASQFNTLFAQVYEQDLERIEQLLERLAEDAEDASFF